MMTVAKVYKKVSISEQPSDTSYWRTRPPYERLAALEEIRNEYHLWKYHAEPRLQRVYSVTKRASGRLQDLADLEDLE
jgi:hypothetical protein